MDWTSIITPIIQTAGPPILCEVAHIGCPPPPPPPPPPPASPLTSPVALIGIGGALLLVLVLVLK